ncbi:uncharacterized protein PAC_16278 [Phialocephala subalpina]|uniref:Uncharacterized protein n=1 Tax=Phialocephala subalpina TaxID=576137 RepID=A0A1L7XN57_9HELO|nr:uncharacterized protein PAC_16278 [Phialocephala subalpina]
MSISHDADQPAKENIAKQVIEEAFRGLGKIKFLEILERLTRVEHKGSTIAPQQLVNELESLPGAQSCIPEREVRTLGEVVDCLRVINQRLDGYIIPISRNNSRNKLLSSPVRRPSPEPKCISETQEDRVMSKNNNLVQISGLKREIEYQKGLVGTIRRNVLRSSLCEWDMGSGTAHEAARQLSEDKTAAQLKKAPYIHPDTGNYLLLANDFDNHSYRPTKPFSKEYLISIHQDATDPRLGVGHTKNHLPWALASLPTLFGSSEAKLAGISRASLFMSLAYLIQRSLELIDLGHCRDMIARAASMTYDAPYRDWNPLDRLCFMWVSSKPPYKGSDRLFPGDDDLKRWKDLEKIFRPQKCFDMLYSLTSVGVGEFLEEKAGYQVLSLGVFTTQMRGVEFPIGDVDEDFELFYFQKYYEKQLQETLVRKIKAGNGAVVEGDVTFVDEIDDLCSP